MPGLRGDNTRSLVPANTQKQPTEGFDFSEIFFFFLHTHTNTHTYTRSSLVNHIHSYMLVSDATAPLFLADFLRQSDWPRLLKMDLEHLPFIAFPLPLPDVTAEHDFPRKSLLPFPTCRTIEEKGLMVLQAGPVFFPVMLGIIVSYFAFLSRCKTSSDSENVLICGAFWNNKAFCSEVPPA